MSLAHLQHLLERIYEVAVPHNVDDFVFSDQDLARTLGTHTDLPTSSEQLFVHEGHHGMDVSLYLEQSVIDNLRDNDPTEHLHDGNLPDFLTALEGVSHFLYLTWNAGFNREVSVLELEMQAEVDKYITSSFLFGQQDEGRVPNELRDWLFGDPRFDDRFDELIRKRYAEANYYAHKFCRSIEDKYLSAPRGVGLINELRRFYRLTRWQKVEHIAATEGSTFKRFVYRH